MAIEKLPTEIRQEQIAQAALSMVATHGLKGLSVAGVARRVGLVPSAIYRHFRSKEEVLDAAIAHIGARLLRNVEEVCEETPDALEQLRRLLMRHIQMVRENQVIAMPRILFSEDVSIGRPERKARILEIIRKYLEGVSGIVRQAQAEGVVRGELDPATLAVMFLGLTQQSAFLWHMSDGRFDVTKHAKGAWKIFTEAITVK